MMRSRTPSKTTAGRSGLLVGVVQRKLLEGAGVGGLLEGAVERLSDTYKYIWKVHIYTPLT